MLLIVFDPSEYNFYWVPLKYLNYLNRNLPFAAGRQPYDVEQNKKSPKQDIK
jgi:hypothetical protein